MRSMCVLAGDDVVSDSRFAAISSNAAQALAATPLF
jgi:hypothetical protein